MNDPTESEEQFEEETLALEEIADETKHEREPHDENAVDEVPEGQQQIEPLKGPHHTPSKE